jgi:hypothetical protein
MEITSWLVFAFTGMSSLVAKGSLDGAPADRCVCWRLSKP